MDNNISIAILGGNGYIGSQLVRSLDFSGYNNITVIDRISSVKNIPEHIKCIKKNILEIEHKDLLGIDVVIDLTISNINEDATMLSSASSYYSIVRSKMSNVKKYIFASSYYVYGYDDRFKSEEDLCEPTSLYGKTKLGLEQFLRTESKLTFKSIILRLASVNGHSPKKGGNVINKMTTNAVENRKISVGRGSVGVPIVDIRDVCDFIIDCINLDMTSNSETYNVVSSNARLDVVANIVRDVVSKKLGIKDIEIDIQDKTEDSSKSCHMSNHKLSSYFDTQYDIEDTIESILHKFDNR